MKDSGKKIVILGVGIPASGKTTLLKPLAKAMSLTYINADDVRLELTGNLTDHSKEMLVWDTIYVRLRLAIESGGAILDATHTRRRDRKSVITFSREHGADLVKAIWVRTDLATSLQRNKARGREVPEAAIRKMHNRLELNPPEKSEGFDEIEIIET